MDVITSIIILSVWLGTILAPLLLLSHGHPPKALEADSTEEVTGTHFMRG